jgi:hypothetical protein
MAVLKEHPHSFGHCHFDCFLSQLSLSLAEGENGELRLEACLFSQVGNLNTGIGSGTQDEDEWSITV